VPDAVFLCCRFDDLEVFVSVEQAERSMEATDVENGEYVAAYRQDGSRLTPTVVDGRVVLSETGEIDGEALTAFLRDYSDRWPSAPQTQDPLSFAAAWLAPRPRPRLLWSLAPIPAVALGWFLFLGWHAERWELPDGSTGGPYHAWQVLALIVLLGACTWVGATCGYAIVAAASATLTVTAMFAADSSGTDESGLWVVGAILTFFGAALGTGIVTALASWNRRRNLPGATPADA
jgi:hypothetical protein